MDYHKLLNSGELYDSVDASLIEQQHKWVQRLNEFNATPDTPDGLEEHTRILKEITPTAKNCSSSRPYPPTTVFAMYTSGKIS